MAKGDVLTTSVVIPIGDKSRDSQNMVLEVPDQLLGIAGGIEVHLYPDVPAELHSSHGGAFSFITPGMVGVLDVPNDFIVFEGEDRMASQYPATTAVTLTKSWDIFYDPQGNRINPSFTYDHATGEVVASAPCYGAVRLAYQTSYRRCSYVPSVKNRGKIPIKVYDTLLAFHDGSVAKFTMTRARDPDDNRDYDQVFAIYSVLVNDKNGAWELPDGYPTTSVTYSGVNRGSAPATKGAHTTKRVHAYIYAEPTYEKINERIIKHRFEQPFPKSTTEGNSTWKPEYLIDENIPDDYVDSFKEKIQKTIEKVKDMYDLA